MNGEGHFAVTVRRLEVRFWTSVVCFAHFKISDVKESTTVDREGLEGKRVLRFNILYST